MKTLKFATVFLLFMLSGYAQPAQKEITGLAYGRHRQNTVDLYFPDSFNPQTPVVIMLHGGAWMRGGNEQTEKTAKKLRNRGLIVTNIDYRYVSDSVHCGQLLEDIDNAVAYIQGQSTRFGFGNTGYHLVGISAGGHLALLYAYNNRRNIKTVIALSAPARLDTPEVVEQIHSLGMEKNLAYLAGEPFDKDKPGNKAYIAISPYANIKAPLPTLLLHGDKDDKVPLWHSEFLYQSLGKVNPEDKKLVVIRNAGHNAGLYDAGSGQQVMNEITNWIKQNK